MSIVKTCRKEFSNVLNQIVRSAPDELKKNEIKTVKKIVKIAAKLLADKVSHKEEKKIVRAIKKTKVGGLKISVDTGSHKTREYQFKGKKIDLGSTTVTREKNQVTFNADIDGIPCQHQFSVNNKKK